MINIGNSTTPVVSSEGEIYAASSAGTAELDSRDQTIDQFRKRIKETFPDVPFTDDKLEQWRGMEALEILRREGRAIPMILGMVTSQEKSAQSELAKKVKELARSNEELEQFAFVTSHDLQEPLRMISNYTEMFVQQYSGKLDEKAEKYLHYIVDGAVRMRTLIRDLLELSRTGRAETCLTRTDSREEVKVVVENLQAAICETGAVVTSGPLPVVMAHGFQLRQVFQNLIGNAIKFHDGQPPSIQVS